MPKPTVRATYSFVQICLRLHGCVVFMDTSIHWSNHHCPPQAEWHYAQRELILLRSAGS